MKKMLNIVMGLICLQGLYSCDSNDQVASASTTKRECFYQEEKISCEKFDQIMGKNQTPNTKQAVTLGSESIADVRFHGQDVILLDDVYLEDQKTTETSQYNCSFLVKRNTVLSLNSTNDKLVARFYNPEDHSEYLDLDFQKQNETQFIFNDLYQNDGEQIKTEIQLEFDLKQSTVRFVSRCHFE